jgi:hypothetical protein
VAGAARVLVMGPIASVRGALAILGPR